MPEAQLLRRRDGDAQAAGLERAGGQARLVLDEQAPGPAGEAPQGQQRRRHLAQRDAVLRAPDRQQLGVAPEAAAPAREVLAADGAAERLQVVAHQERLAGGRQPVHAVGGIALAGGRALQMAGEGERGAPHPHSSRSGG